MSGRELTEALAEIDRLRAELARTQEGLREFARDRDRFRHELEAERERRQGVEKELAATELTEAYQRERAKRAERQVEDVTRERDEARRVARRLAIEGVYDHHMSAVAEWSRGVALAYEVKP